LGTYYSAHNGDHSLRSNEAQTPLKGGIPKKVVGNGPALLCPAAPISLAISEAEQRLRRRKSILALFIRLMQPLGLPVDINESLAKAITYYFEGLDKLPTLN
jgi:hypothetical protein